MTRQSDVRYVNFYTSGTAARQVERKSEKKPVKQTVAAAPVRRIPIPFDPVAVFGTTVALVMLVCMLVGLAQVNTANEQVQAMEHYVTQLEAENARLQSEYAEGYDLDEIRIAANSMGLVPVEQVRHITITIPEEEAVEQPTWWEQLLLDFQELFA